MSKPRLRQRHISDKLLKMLDITGCYHKVTEIVKVDPYLDMEMRGNTGAIVYYRGGKILTINEEKGLIGLDAKYFRGNLPNLVPDIDNIFEYFCNAKHIMDIYESTVKSKLGEKEIQQRVVFENNLSVNADNTDYFVVDVEWADNNRLGGRADIVAFRWDHTIQSHKKRCLTLTLIEVKQGEKAIKTKVGGNPGLKKHYADYVRILQDKNYIADIKKDMLCVLEQKNQLGLIKGLDKLYTNGKKKFIPNVDNNVDFVFLLANYHLYSTALKVEWQLLPPNCKFYVASFMGYGLYKDRVYSKEEIEKIFSDII